MLININIAHIECEMQMLSITDIVLNHTANESPWLRDHPESAYNLENSPHLRPAFVMDRALHYFSKEISAGKWTDRGIPPEVTGDHHIQVCLSLRSFERMIGIGDIFQPLWLMVSKLSTNFAILLTPLLWTMSVWFHAETLLLLTSNISHYPYFELYLHTSR